MIIVKVTYTVAPDFVNKNQQNVRLFLVDFKKLNLNDFQYNVYLCEDGKTFVHLSHYKNEKIQKQVLEVDSFVFFQKQRDDSRLEHKPSIETMELITSTKDIL